MSHLLPGRSWTALLLSMLLGLLTVSAFGTQQMVIDDFDYPGVEAARAAWASPEKPLHLERNYGTMHGALVFE